MNKLSISPVSGLITLGLLLLMVQLAGLNAPREVAIAIDEVSSLELSLDAFSVQQSAPADAQESSTAPSSEAEDRAQAPPMEPLAFALEPLLPTELEPLALEPLESEALELEINVSTPSLDSVALKVKKPVPKPRVQPRRSELAKPKPRYKAARVARNTATKNAQGASGAGKKASAKTGAAAASAPGKAITAKAATPTRRVEPTYPRRAVRRSIEGVVTVNFTVSERGQVVRSSIKVVRAEPAKVFDKAVVSALSKWRFSPSNGPYQLTKNFEFSLD